MSCVRLGIDLDVVNGFFPRGGKFSKQSAPIPSSRAPPWPDCGYGSYACERFITDLFSAGGSRLSWMVLYVFTKWCLITDLSPRRGRTSAIMKPRVEKMNGKNDPDVNAPRWLTFDPGREVIKCLSLGFHLKFRLPERRRSVSSNRAASRDGSYSCKRIFWFLLTT